MNQPVRILYVDDYPLDRELVRDALEKEHGGFEVVEAASRADFETTLAQGGFDLILSDFNILGFEGLQVLEAVRATGSLLPVIIVTGTGSEEVAAEAIKRGAADYIIKTPQHIRRLPHAIHAVLEKKQLEDERQQAEEALRESEDKFKYMFDHSIIGKSITLPSGEINVNKAFCDMLGYTQEELQSQKWQDITHPDDIELTQRALDPLLSGEQDSARFSKRYIHKNGAIVWADVFTSLRRDREGQPLYFITTVSDITERQQAEEQVRASLQEKELLLRELYHRTRNNMLVIRAMLEIQAVYLDHPQVQQLVRDTQNRIQAMALVHDKLYQAQNLSRIPLDEYVVELAQLLQSMFRGPANRVALSFATEPILTLIDIALPCGLILNELVSNALKHAFPGERAGEIRIGLRRTGPGELLLEVADNGVGLPAGFDWRHTDSMGLSTAAAIVQHQLQGTLAFETGVGVTCRVQFRDDLYNARV